MHVLWALLLAMGLLPAPKVISAEPPAPLLILHATLIDGTDAPARPNMAVLVEAGRIAAVAPADAIGRPRHARVVDATGKFLIPGLWDMHVHVSAIGERALALLLARGITGLRDMGSDPDEVFAWRARLENGSLLGPHVASPGLLIDGPRRSRHHRILVASRAEGTQAVARLAAWGADFIKVHSWLPREAYLGLAAEVKRRGLVLAGHVPASVNASEAAEAGHRSIEHLFGLGLASSSREAELRQTLLESVRGSDDMKEWDAIATAEADAIESLSDEKMVGLFAELARREVRVCPTLAFYRDIPPEYPWAARIFRSAPRLIAAMRRAGVEILAGTDLAELPPPDWDVHTELAVLVEAGLTPLEALQAATRNPARILGRSKALGTVEIGKHADLVLLEADPLADIRNTRALHAVVKDGRWFSREALRELASGVQAPTLRPR